MSPVTQMDLATDSEHVYTVSEINDEARLLLEDQYPRIRVQGEISNYLHHSSGHRYFKLKDERASISCAFFSGRARNLKFKLVNGQNVVCTGQLSLYTQRGEYQMIVEAIEIGGIGMLFQRLEELKKKLQAEGLFDPVRKRPLPPFPESVGVVTSAEGAAIRDILKMLHNRSARVSVLIYPVKVQGEGAAKEIADGIRWMSRNGGCDVIITGRGGGSIEDLWAFNEEVVARAIVESAVPVISAVGHEKDVLLSDLVADARAPTPSGAAEMIAKTREEIGHRIQGQVAQMSVLAGRSLATRRDQMFRLRESPAFRRLPGIINQLIQRVESMRVTVEQQARARTDRGRQATAAMRVRLERSSPSAILQRRIETVRSLKARNDLLIRRALDERLQRARALHGVLLARLPLHILARQGQSLSHVRTQLLASAHSQIDLRRARLDSVASLLRAVGPSAVLDRGYSICFKQDGGTVVSDSSAVARGERLVIRMRKGKLAAVATGEIEESSERDR